MTRLRPDQAWRRGLQTLMQHPWLALIPMLWTAVQVALAWVGIPLGAVPDLGRLADERYQIFLERPVRTGDTLLKAFLPDWLPTVADLQIRLQPESLAVRAGLPVWAALTGLLLVPLLHALAQSAFLGLAAELVTQNGPGWLRRGFRRALRAVPGLYILGLLWRMALMLTPVDGLMVLALVWIPFFPLLPLVVAAGDLPLVSALGEAPRQLWSRLGAWFGLGWRTLLTTAIFHLLWVLTGGSTLVGLHVYPFVATWALCAAVALYVGDAEAAPPSLPAWISLAAIAAAVPLAVVAWHLPAQWEGYRVTREAALGSLARGVRTLRLASPRLGADG